MRIPRLEGEVEILSGLHKQKFVLQRENQALKTNISGLEKQLVSIGKRREYPRNLHPINLTFGLSGSSGYLCKEQVWKNWKCSNYPMSHQNILKIVTLSRVWDSRN